MTHDELLKPVEAPLRDLIAWLTDRKTPHVIIGGVAASLQGKPRATGDIDAVIMTDETALAEFLTDAAAHGFPPRIANAREFAVANRVILLKHTGDDINVDLSMGILPFEEDMIARAVRTHAFGIDVPLASPEHLIVMKTLAFRPRDVGDIESLLDKNPRIEFRRVRRWLRLVSESLEDPEIAARLEKLLAMRRDARPRKKKTPRKR